METKTSSKSVDEDLRVRLEKRRRHVVQRQTTEDDVDERERAESPPVKIVKIVDEPKIEEARRPEPPLVTLYSSGVHNANIMAGLKD